MNSGAEQTVVLATGAGAAALWALANDAAAAMFGLPIGVLLAAAAGAFFGRTFTPAAGFWLSLRAGVGWPLAGAYTLPLAMHHSGLPAKLAASAAFVLALTLQLLAPVLVPVIIAAAPAWLRRVLNSFAGGQAIQGGNHADTGNGDERTQ